jgi:hypothetical protein
MNNQNYGGKPAFQRSAQPPQQPQRFYKDPSPRQFNVPTVNPKIREHMRFLL